MNTTQKHKEVKKGEDFHQTKTINSPPHSHAIIQGPTITTTTKKKSHRDWESIKPLTNYLAQGLVVEESQPECNKRLISS